MQPAGTLANACEVVAQAVKAMPEGPRMQCGSALRHALITDKTLVPPPPR